MNYSRLDRHKKNKSKTKWVITAVVILLMAVGTIIYFSFDKKSTVEESNPNAQSSAQNGETPPKATEQVKVKEPVSKVESPEVDEAGYAAVQLSLIHI